MSSFSGAKLKELRVSAGLSQKALADKAGTTQQSVARWETDKVEPSGSHLFKLADALGVSVRAISEGLDVDHSVKVKMYREAMGGRFADVPWGTASLNLKGHERPIEFAVDEWNENCLRDDLWELGERGEIFSFEALGERLVLFKVNCLKSLKLLNDAVVAMPYYATDDAMKLFRDCSVDEGELMDRFPSLYEDYGNGEFHPDEVVAYFDDGSKQRFVNDELDNIDSRNGYKFVARLYEDFSRSADASSRSPISRIMEEGEYQKSLINMDNVSLLVLPLKPFISNDYSGEGASLDDLDGSFFEHEDE